VITSNITTTTMIGLKPNTRYQFRLAAISENVVYSSHWLQRDMYGRRTPTPGYVLGNFTVTDVVATLLYGKRRRSRFVSRTSLGFHVSSLREVDFDFPIFDANSTLDFGPFDKRAAEGQIGETLGEGHYGLVIVGDANVSSSSAGFGCGAVYRPPHTSRFCGMTGGKL
jgi:hypothetical protein